MAEEGNPISPPEWVSKTLATIDAISGYTYAALAVAGGVIIFLPSPIFGVDLGPLRKVWGAWIGAGTIAFAVLMIAKMARTFHTWVVSALIVRNARRAQGMREADVLAHLATLSNEERKLLARCLADNRRSVMGNHLNASLVQLASKGLFEIPTQISTPMQMTYVIPDFVWVALQERKADFPP